jgi:extradiol dioxygenase family protein
VVVPRCSPDAPEGACEEIRVGDAAVVVQRDTVMRRVLATATEDPSNPSATAMVAVVDDLDVPLEPAARVLLAEDWHALAAQVEADVVARSDTPSP